LSWLGLWRGWRGVYNGFSHYNKKEKDVLEINPKGIKVYIYIYLSIYIIYILLRPGLKFPSLGTTHTRTLANATVEEQKNTTPNNLTQGFLLQNTA